MVEITGFGFIFPVLTLVPFPEGRSHPWYTLRWFLCSYVGSLSWRPVTSVVHLALVVFHVLSVLALVLFLFYRLRKPPLPPSYLCAFCVVSIIIWFFAWFLCPYCHWSFSTLGFRRVLRLCRCRCIRLASFFWLFRDSPRVVRIGFHAFGWIGFVHIGSMTTRIAYLCLVRDIPLFRGGCFQCALSSIYIYIYLVDSFFFLIFFSLLHNCSNYFKAL